MLIPGSFLNSTTIDDLDMLDPATAEQRPSLSTSLSDFALTSSAPSSPSSIISPEDGLSPFFRRLRRSSLLASNPITADADAKPSSPLATSFTPRLSFDSKMTDDGSSNSDTPSRTPSLLFDARSASSDTPARPPCRASPPNLTVDTLENLTRRRVSLPPKPARLLDLRSELRSPIESELKSEAQFQRLIASYSYNGFPHSKHLPHTPRAWSDRGRYPEEAGGDDDGSQGAESASDDGEDEKTNASTSASASVNASMSVTPSGSGEEQAMTIDTAIVGTFMMDVDTPSAVNSPTQWRQTPPPILSSIRPGKRKFDDRYDPYPSAAKRRAVSPSVHTHHSHHPHSHSHTHGHAHHSHSHSHSHSYHSRPSSHAHSTTPISIPISRPRSLTSSPVIHPTSSPVMRPTSFPGQSPVLKGSPTVRPVPRLTLKSGPDMQRGVDGAGEAVGSLSIA